MSLDSLHRVLSGSVSATSAPSGGLAEALSGTEAYDAVSPVFSLELSQRSSGIQGASSDERIREKGRAAAWQSVLALVRPQTDFEAQLQEHVRLLKARSGAVLGPEALAQALGQLGYILQYKCQDPGDTHAHGGRRCLENLHHKFLVCSGHMDSSSYVSIFIEANFREHFHIAHSTPAHSALVAAVPAEFVGTPQRLAALVEVLSEAVADAFAAQGLPLPPWRRAKSVLSKWGLGHVRATQRAQRTAATQQSGFMRPERAPPLPQHSEGAAVAGVLRRSLARGRLPVHPEPLGAEIDGVTDDSYATQPGSKRHFAPAPEVAIEARGGALRAALPWVGSTSEGAVPCGGKRRVSLLARGLAGLQNAPKQAAVEAAPAAKPRMSPSWLLGLPHITTVRCVGGTRSTRLDA